MNKPTVAACAADSKPKDYSATLRAVKSLRDKCHLEHLLDSMADLTLYIGDSDGYKDNAQTLAIACSNLFNLLSHLAFLYNEFEYNERKNNDQ